MKESNRAILLVPCTCLIPLQVQMHSLYYVTNYFDRIIFIPKKTAENLIVSFQKRIHTNKKTKIVT